MSDPLFVAASYAIVLGGLIAYAVSIARRTRAARRTAHILEQERDRARSGAAAGHSVTARGQAAEAP